MRETWKGSRKGKGRDVGDGVSQRDMEEPRMVGPGEWNRSTPLESNHRNRRGWRSERTESMPVYPHRPNEARPGTTHRRTERSRTDGTGRLGQAHTNRKSEPCRILLAPTIDHRGDRPRSNLQHPTRMEEHQPRLRLALCRLSWMNLSVLGLLRVRFPLVGFPHGVTEGLPPEVFPSPPPWG